MTDSMTTAVYINPGSGPIDASTTANRAAANMHRLLRDVGVPGATFRPAARYFDDGEGRYAFYVRAPGRREWLVHMPGTPLRRVRWLGEPSGCILDFPRLYVDGNSWVWKYAVETVRDLLLTGRA